MIVNGVETARTAGTLAEFLAAAGYDISRVAVEKNGIIVPRGKFESEVLNDNDKLEVVHFVGGG